MVIQQHTNASDRARDLRWDHATNSPDKREAVKPEDDWKMQLLYPSKPCMILLEPWNYQLPDLPLTFAESVV